LLWSRDPAHRELEDVERLVRAGVLREREEIFHLRFEEIQDVVLTNQMDEQLVRRRKDEFTSYQAPTPPRVLTSEGEVIAGGLPVLARPGRCSTF
jgi:hypothetical protein